MRTGRSGYPPGLKRNISLQDEEARIYRPRYQRLTHEVNEGIWRYESVQGSWPSYETNLCSAIYALPHRLIWSHGDIFDSPLLSADVSGSFILYHLGRIQHIAGVQSSYATTSCPMTSILEQKLQIIMRSARQLRLAGLALSVMAGEGKVVSLREVVVDGDGPGYREALRARRNGSRSLLAVVKTR